MVVDSAPVMSSDLYSLSVALNQMFVSDAQPHNPPRWSKCAKAAANAIPMEVSRVYISKFLNDEVIQSAFSIVARVHHALKDLLDRVTWMQASLKMHRNCFLLCIFLTVCRLKRAKKLLRR